MEFKQLHSGTNCDCISSAVENYVASFSRKVSDKPNLLHIRNFRLPTKFRDAPFVDCKTHCATKSLSIDIFNGENESFLCKLHSESVGIAPAFRSQLLVFKIKEEGGMVKPTPSKKNPYHYDLYCPDGFEPEVCIEAIKTVKLNYDDV